MEVNGEVLVILFKDCLDENNEETCAHFEGQTGWYFKIFFESDNNLEDDTAIVKWVDCSDYDSSERRTVDEPDPNTMYYGTQKISQCAKPDADAIVIISGVTAL